MVAVIEDKEEAGSARYIEFRVCRSPTDPDRILGSWRYSGSIEMVIDQSRPDGPVKAEFRHVLECADQNGVAFVWINDPDQLFPLWARR
jgi:hypothetical protein